MLKYGWWFCLFIFETTVFIVTSKPDYSDIKDFAGHDSWEERIDWDKSWEERSWEERSDHQSWKERLGGKSYRPTNRMAKVNLKKSCGLTEWSDWSQPSQSCGNVTIIRNRACMPKGCTVYECNTATYEERKSFRHGPCCYWTQWGLWSEATETCGNARRTRGRYCICNGDLTTENERCGGMSVDFQKLVYDNCCSWESWSSWSSLTETCGSDIVMSRQRRCADAETGDKCYSCPGDRSEFESRDLPECETNRMAVYNRIAPDTYSKTETFKKLRQPFDSGEIEFYDETEPESYKNRNNHKTYGVVGNGFNQAENEVAELLKKLELKLKPKNYNDDISSEEIERSSFVEATPGTYSNRMSQSKKLPKPYA